MKNLKAVLLISFIMIVGSLSNAYGQNLNLFKSLLDSCRMNYTVPEGYVECDIKKNRNMSYEYALKPVGEDNFEIRYSIRPITKKEYASEEEKESLESMSEFRNSGYDVAFTAILFNISQGGAIKPQLFDKVSVKNDFNADWGSFSKVEFTSKSEFGEGFKSCMAIAIHKENVADAYIYYLFNDDSLFEKYAMPIFKILRFDEGGELQTQQDPRMLGDWKLTDNQSSLWGRTRRN